MLPSANPDSVGALVRCFQGSILSLHVPLSTLHAAPLDTPRMTRGQDSSLLLSCMTLSFTTRRRFVPAHQAKPPAPHGHQFILRPKRKVRSSMPSRPVLAIPSACMKVALLTLLVGLAW